MPVKQRNSSARLVSLIILIFILTLVVAACSSSEEPETTYTGVNTQLLVTEPNGPLLLNEQIGVKSTSNDSQYGISHVELYAVQLPDGNSDILLRSDAAPFNQTSFTASQIFTPKQSGRYVIQVVGYNRIGESSITNALGFEVR